MTSVDTGTDMKFQVLSLDTANATRRKEIVNGIMKQKSASLIGLLQIEPIGVVTGRPFRDDKTREVR